MYFQFKKPTNKFQFWLRRTMFQINKKVIIIRFLLEGCVELGLTAMISTIVIFNPPMRNENSREDRLLFEATKMTFSDMLSNICACLTLVGLLIAPIYMLRIAWIYYKKHEDIDVKKKYGQMFEGFQVKTFP